jgi:hypothetical protein
MNNKHFIDNMDAAFPDGKFVELSKEPPRIRFRDMDVEKKNTRISEEEMNQFRY